MTTTRGAQGSTALASGKREALGIVIADSRVASPSEPGAGPRIAAFIWGGKVRPTPTLPYGRWKRAL